MDSKGLLRIPARKRRGGLTVAPGEAVARALDKALTPASGSKPRTRQPGCPHCRSERFIHWGAAHGIPRYRCGSCKRTFNILTNTPLARLRNKERWLTFVGTIVEKKSIRKSAAACGVSVTTSSRWHKRFLQCSSADRTRIIREIILAISNASALSAASGSIGSADLAWAKELLPAVLSWLV